MKKFLVLLLCLVMLLSLTACGTGQNSDAAADEPKEVVQETKAGIGKGFGGMIYATVVVEGDTIVSVELVGDKETDGVGTLAIDQLPAVFVEANSTDVDVVTGATYSSKGAIYAVNNALDPENYPAPEEESEKVVEDITTAEAYLGFGIDNAARKGPGSDDQGVQVWSFNQVFTSAIFDSEGKILKLHIDRLEVATPNYDGENMSHLSGFPGQGGYNYDSNHDEVIDSVTPDTEEQYLSEVQGWTTKREYGDSYLLSSGTSWTDQIEAFESMFVGMTVDEVEEWFNKYASDVNGRPLTETSTKPEDIAKYGTLSDDEKAMLVDVTSAATMSLNDAHGNIIASIKNSYENRIPITVEQASGLGLGIVSTPRKGPGSDDQEVQVWGFNEVYVTALFDSEDRIAQLFIDQLEIATPNYDGESMPHFSGFPGQGGYNYDSDHDEVVDSKTPDTEEQYFAEIAGWVTKRQRGEGYVLSSGKNWTDEIETYEDLFVGMTVDEVEEWFLTYTSDANGRPLTAESSKAGDPEKYAALSDDEKAMLVDVTSSATMSLSDAHGDIIGAIKAALEGKAEINLEIGK